MHSPVCMTAGCVTTLSSLFAGGNLLFVSRWRLSRVVFSELRTIYGVISVQIRLAMALRVLAGASYLDTGVMFGVALPTVYQNLWVVIDAINRTPEVGPFFFPRTEFDLRGHAARFKVGAFMRGQVPLAPAPLPPLSCPT